MTSVYIETTIPSFYYTARTDTQSLARRDWTREWWTAYSLKFEFCSSAAVIVELERGTRQSEKNQRLALIQGVEQLEITAEVRDVARIYIERLVMPQDAAGDALHLTLTSYHGIDVLLTWNCNHLANPNKFGHIRKVNDELQIAVPLLTTPLNYLSKDNADD